MKLTKNERRVLRNRKFWKRIRTALREQRTAFELDEL